MKADLYTLCYAVALGVVCAVLLTAAGQFAQPYREANARVDKMRQVLKVLGIEVGPEQTVPELTRIFDANVRGREQDDLLIYEYVTADGLQALAVPFAGPGLWGPIKGFLALEPDLATIRGVSFYEQEETPGLGGEIAGDWFQGQFKGRMLRNAEGTPGIRIRRGGARENNEVDAVSGATMTCDKVEDMLNRTIRRILQEHNSHE